MYEGSCLCGKVKYQVLSEPKKVSHCHCKMCQKQHGAAFATYASVRKEHLKYVQGKGVLKSYNSSGTIQRKFCECCGSNLEWSGSKDYREWVSISLGTFDTEIQPETIVNIYTDTKVCWFEIGQQSVKHDN